MSVEIVTGVSEREHVSSAQDGRRNAFTFGTGRYVFDSGGKFAYTLISNNLIKISDGDLMDQGRHICTEPNDYTELTIDNGISGNNRKDIIAMRYEKNADTGFETASLVVIKGISTAGTASDPEHVEGNILNGDLVDEFPLYRVNLSGISIVSIDVLFQIFPVSGIINTLPLSGGTLTSGEYEILHLKRTGSDAGVGIKFENSNGTLGSIYMSGGADTGLHRNTADGSKSYTFLDSGNYQTYVTPANIGAMSVTGDSANNIATFTTGDAAIPTGWTDVPVLSSGEKHSSIFNKISTMFKNVRYTYSTLSGFLNTLKYTNISSYVTYNSSTISFVNAWCESGIVVVYVTLKAEAVGAIQFTITQSRYCPTSGGVCGNYAALTTSTDKEKFSGALISADGAGTIWITSALTSTEFVCFTYPVRFG